MSNQEPALHYVSTLDEARKIIAEHDQFWVINCGCREHHGPCKQSRIDVCLEFSGGEVSWGSNKHPATRAEVESILREAEEKHLVARPFRDQKTKTVTDGICFCCECCCDYFVEKDTHRCDKGAYIEVTDKDLCAHCGTCEDYCYFGARKLEGEELVIDREECYGCGLCVEVCPEGCVRMIAKN